VSEKVILVVSGGDLCGFPFSKGFEYLIYGRRLPNGDVYVGASSTAKWKKDAAKNPQYFRGLAGAPHGATIYERGLRYTAPESPRARIRLGEPQIQAARSQFKAQAKVMRPLLITMGISNFQGCHRDVM
jgi:hypothetical protein